MKALIRSSNQPKQSTFHVKKGDEVVILAGTQRGKRGKVLKVNRGNNRVLVEGVNMIKKAARPTQENPKGSITELEGSIHISNLMLASAHAQGRSQAGKAAGSETAAAKPAKAAKAKKED